MKSTPICCLLLLLSLICYRGHSASLSGNEIRVSGNQISETAMEESNVLRLTPSAINKPNNRTNSLL
ncbi:hypothetical protein XELAEV_18036326mg [Xenopus laevis]|uniref:Uncharacterized protein n=1 Tax=Xenopus laevis TaxID=8355 RepID=A0A974CHF1_XENLA|nr:hypothetical protein XELAEV_18036326mg [Xenopus laevis]